MELTKLSPKEQNINRIDLIGLRNIRHYNIKHYISWEPKDFQDLYKYAHEMQIIAPYKASSDTNEEILYGIYNDACVVSTTNTEVFDQLHDEINDIENKIVKWPKLIYRKVALSEIINLMLENIPTESKLIITDGHDTDHGMTRIVLTMQDLIEYRKNTIQLELIEPDTFEQALITKYKETAKLHNIPLELILVTNKDDNTHEIAMRVPSTNSLSKTHKTNKFLKQIQNLTKQAIADADNKIHNLNMEAIYADKEFTTVPNDKIQELFHKAQQNEQKSKQ